MQKFSGQIRFDENVKIRLKDNAEFFRGGERKGGGDRFVKKFRSFGKFLEYCSKFWSAKAYNRPLQEPHSFPHSYHNQ